MTQYLGDTSALGRLRLDTVKNRVDPMLRRGLISLCAPIEFELLFSARNLDDRNRLKNELVATFPWVPTGHDDLDEALRLQHELTSRGKHRCASLVDALLCVIAARASLTILHYDRDFETIAEVTGQPNEWVVPPGTV